MYSGKAASLGLKHAPSSSSLPERWLELPVPRAPAVAQLAVGHEGQHALLVTEDGAVFFTGTPRRGEDGDVGRWLAEGRVGG